MSRNPESVVTARARSELEARGAYFLKLSDSFTRGIPDSIVTTDRLMAIEFKVDRTSGTLDRRTYSSLGLSGAQDSRLRAIAHRSVRSAYVLTDTVVMNRMELWIPDSPAREGKGFEYWVRVSRGVGDCMFILTGRH